MSGPFLSAGEIGRLYPDQETCHKNIPSLHNAVRACVVQHSQQNLHFLQSVLFTRLYRFKSSLSCSSSPMSPFKKKKKKSNLHNLGLQRSISSPFRGKHFFPGSALMAKVLSPDLQLLSTRNRVEYSRSNFLQGSPGPIFKLERVIDRSWRALAAVRVLPANHGSCWHCSDTNSVSHPQLQLLL